MDDVKTFGRVLHHLSFKQAIDEGLLCPYRVVVMPVSDEEVAELVQRRKLVTADGDHVTDAYTLAAQIACLRTLRRFDCQRLVAFHASVENSKRFATDLETARCDAEARWRPGDPSRRETEAAAHGEMIASRPTRRVARAGRMGNQTATCDFGHFCAKVPKSLHIGAYRRVFVIGAFRHAITKPLQVATFAARGYRRSPLFQALMRISAWNGPDALRWWPIPPCIDPAAAVTADGEILLFDGPA